MKFPHSIDSPRSRSYRLWCDCVHAGGGARDVPPSGPDDGPRGGPLRGVHRALAVAGPEARLHRESAAAAVRDACPRAGHRPRTHSPVPARTRTQRRGLQQGEEGTTQEQTHHAAALGRSRALHRVVAAAG